MANLPFAHGHRFCAMDEYLAHLDREAAPIGQPWYREIRPGVYALQTNLAPAPERQTFTREELERRFGFSR